MSIIELDDETKFSRVPRLTIVVCWLLYNYVVVYVSLKFGVVDTGSIDFQLLRHQFC